MAIRVKNNCRDWLPMLTIGGQLFFLRKPGRGPALTTLPSSAYLTVLLLLLIGCLTVWNTLSVEEMRPTSFADSADLTFGQLVNFQVTSVSKKKTPINQAPAAIAINTPEDIRQSGTRAFSDPYETWRFLTRWKLCLSPCD